MKQCVRQGGGAEKHGHAGEIHRPPGVDIAEGIARAVVKPRHGGDEGEEVVDIGGAHRVRRLLAVGVDEPEAGEKGGHQKGKTALCLPPLLVKGDGHRHHGKARGKGEQGEHRPGKAAHRAGRHGHALGRPGTEEGRPGDDPNEQGQEAAPRLKGRAELLRPLRSGPEPEQKKHDHRRRGAHRGHGDAGRGAGNGKAGVRLEPGFQLPRPQAGSPGPGSQGQNGQQILFTEHDDPLFMGQNRQKPRARPAGHCAQPRQAPGANGCITRYYNIAAGKMKGIFPLPRQSLIVKRDGPCYNKIYCMDRPWLLHQPRRVCARRRKSSLMYFRRRRVRRRKFFSACSPYEQRECAAAGRDLFKREPSEAGLV